MMKMKMVVIMMVMMMRGLLGRLELKDAPCSEMGDGVSVSVLCVSLCG